LRPVADVAWIGLDAGHRDLGDTEHAALAVADVLGCAEEICTHAVQGAVPYYAASLRLARGVNAWEPEFLEELRGLAEGAVVYERGKWAVEVGDAPGRVGARAAVAAHAAGAGGRAIRFAGQARLQGAVRVTDVLSSTAIRDVQVLGGALASEAIVETRNYVRPQYTVGSLTLVVTPLDDGRLQPFEIEYAHQCCDGH